MLYRMLCAMRLGHFISSDQRHFAWLRFVVERIFKVPEVLYVGDVIRETHIDPLCHIRMAKCLREDFLEQHRIELNVSTQPMNEVEQWMWNYFFRMRRMLVPFRKRRCWCIITKRNSSLFGLAAVLGLPAMNIRAEFSYASMFNNLFKMTTIIPQLVRTYAGLPKVLISLVDSVGKNMPVDIIFAYSYSCTQLTQLLVS